MRTRERPCEGGGLQLGTKPSWVGGYLTLVAAGPYLAPMINMCLSLISSQNRTEQNLFFAAKFAAEFAAEFEAESKAENKQKKQLLLFSCHTISCVCVLERDFVSLNINGQLERQRPT